MAANFDLVWLAKKKKRKRKKKEDFLNVECEELTYPFSLLLEFSVDWT